MLVRTSHNTAASIPWPLVPVVGLFAACVLLLIAVVWLLAVVIGALVALALGRERELPQPEPDAAPIRLHFTVARL